MTKGILINTGSLGQTLSKASGFAVTDRLNNNANTSRYAVVIGDGELQEGQIFESLQTIYTYKLTNITIIIDINNFQTDNLVTDIKQIHDYKLLFESFGYEVFEVLDGHNCNDIKAAWEQTKNKLAVILLHTVKGGGSEFTKPIGNYQPWHGKIPNWIEYSKIVNEQLENAKKFANNNEKLLAILATIPWSDEKMAQYTQLKDPIKSTALGTGKVFGGALIHLLNKNSKVCVLDADLASSCGLSASIKHERYFELGISEQDMVSFAGGSYFQFLYPNVRTLNTFLSRIGTE